VAPTQPQFPGGAQAMSDFITKNLKYPADAKQQGKDGYVMIQFVVEKDGSRSNVKVMRNGKLPSMDNEALRVVNSMPKFSPGRNENNQPVRVKFTVPVRFKLN
jgi:TonB family protein